MGKAGPMDWNDLRYFLAAVRAGTLAGAARTLGVEHSTIGRRLTALEEALGAALLTRGPDGLSLTVAGERVVPLLEEMERAAQAIVQVVHSQKARVRLATPTGFSRYLAPHLGAFHAAHPEITVEILSGSRPVDLKKSEADVALRAGIIEDEELHARKVGDMGFALYASAAYLQRHAVPADPRDLVGQEVLGYDASLGSVPAAKWLEEHGRGATVVMRCREITDMLAACVAGLGLAVLPCMAGALEPSLRQLTPEPLGSSRLSLVYRKEALIAAPVKAVVAFVAEVMKQYAGQMSGRGDQ